MNNRQKIKAIIELIIVVLLFIIFSVIIQANLPFLKLIIGKNIFSMGLYIFLLILAVVFAPLTLDPLIPLASNLWGWPLAGLLTLSGWLIGSMVAFEIARDYGTKLIGKFVSIDQLNRIESFIPEKNLFWGIVLLRIAIPIDIVSYALGLFSNISRTKYFFATLIGLIPAAFILAYIGALRLIFQIMFFLLIGNIFLSIWIIFIVFKKE